MNADFDIRPITAKDQALVIQLLEDWGMRQVVRKGEMVDAATLPGYIAWADDDAVGLLNYAIAGDSFEVVTLKSWREGQGIGSALLDTAKAAAHTANCVDIWLITTNDNLHALGFYQRRGFILRAMYPDALAATRALKPEVPDIGMNGIPLRDEIELVYAV